MATTRNDQAAIGLPPTPSAPSCGCGCCSTLERVHYFTRQLMTADDMIVEQEYFREKLRRHNRYLHGWGVTCGCAVFADPTSEMPWRVKICPGYAVSPQGDEIAICQSTYFNLAGDWNKADDPCAKPWPCPPAGPFGGSEEDHRVFLAVRYAECNARPVRIHPVGCSCSDAACEYSRIRDDFQLALLWELPDCYKEAAEADKEWCDEIKKWFSAAPPQGRPSLPMPAPPCPDCCDSPWVILATILLPPDQKTPIKAGNISYDDRKVILSTDAIQQMVICMK